MGGDSNCTHLRVKRFAAGTIGDSPATKGSFGDGALGAGGSYDDSLTCMWVITASDYEDDDEAGGSSSSVVRLVVDGLRLWSHDSLRVFSGDLTALAPRSSSLTGLGSSNTVVDPTIDYSLATSPEMANQDDDSGSGSDARVGVLLAHLTGYDEVWPPLESTTGSMTVVLQTDGVADRSYNERFGDGFQASFDAGVNATFKGRNCTSDADCKQASTTSTTSSGPSGSTCGAGGVCGCLPGYSGADCSHPSCLGTAVSRGSSGEFKSAANALSAQHLYANQADCLFVAEVGARFSFVRFNVTFDLEATFDELLVRAGGDGRVGVTNPWLLTSPRLAAEAGAASEAGRQDADGAVTYVRLSAVKVCRWLCPPPRPAAAEASTQRACASSRTTSEGGPGLSRRFKASPASASLAATTATALRRGMRSAAATARAKKAPARARKAGSASTAPSRLAWM